MKLLKKTSLIILLLIVVVAIGLAVFLQIRKYNANKQLLHKQSTAVLKIAIDDILTDALLSEIKNFSFFEKDSLDKIESDKKWDIGVDVPASIYFFSLNNDLKTLYSYQKLSDKALFLKSITAALKLDSSAINKDSDSWNLVSNDGRVKCIGDEKYVLICINLLGTNNWVELTKLWENKSTVLQEVQDFVPLKTIVLDKDIVYANVKSNDVYSLDFEDNKAIASAAIHSVILKPIAGNKVQKTNKEAILAGYLNLDIHPILVKYDSYFKKSPVVKQMLLNYFGNYIGVEWDRGLLAQEDTVITYDYNDDFELIEKESVQKRQVPNLLLTIKGNKNLYSLIPNKIYFNFNKKVEDEYLIMYTGQEDSRDFELLDSPYFISLEYNYDQSVENYFNKYPQLLEIKQLSIRGQCVDDKSTLFEAEIKFKNENKHPLVAFF